MTGSETVDSGTSGHTNAGPRTFNAFASQDSHKHHVARLNADGRNIGQWLTEAEIALSDCAPSLWDETAAQPANEPAALRRLIMIVDPQLQASVKAAKTAPEAWEQLRNQFKPVSRLREASVLKAFSNFQYVDGETITAFLQRFDDIVRALSELEDHAISVPLQVVQLLGALPVEYKGFYDSTIRDPSIKHVRQLRYPLLDYEAHLNTSNLTGMGAAMAAYAQHGPAAFGAFTQQQQQQQQQHYHQQQQQQQRKDCGSAPSSAATAAAAAAASANSTINLNIAASHSTRHASSTLVAGFIVHMLPTQLLVLSCSTLAHLNTCIVLAMTSSATASCNRHSSSCLVLVSIFQR
jgi:hypothetical protein